jgi:secretion/DNA translocation related CpaE-like protein
MEISVRTKLLLITADGVVLDQALAVCAAVGVEPEVVADAGAARASWAEAGLVMIGGDQAQQLVALGLPGRARVLLLAAEDDHELAVPSLRLGAPIVVLPGGSSELVAAVAGVAGRAGRRGRVVSVVGGSGGVGVSTVACALGFVAARSGRRAAVVDLDPLGGGIDLLLGAERLPGWRWPRLSTARGQLGDLSGQLPHLDGVDLVAMGRGAETAQPPAGEAVAVVVGSLVRSHDLVVLDAARGTGLGRSALALADVGLLVVAGDVRGIAAGRETFGALDRGGQAWNLLVRRPRAGGLEPSNAAAGLEAGLLGVLADDPAVALAAARGEPPARAARSQLARVCRQVLETAVWPDATAA